MLLSKATCNYCIQGDLYLAQGHFGMQMGKTEDRATTFWMEDDCSARQPQPPPSVLFEYFNTSPSPVWRDLQGSVHPIKEKHLSFIPGRIQLFVILFVQFFYMWLKYSSTLTQMLL